MRVSKDFILREIAGELMLVPTGTSAGKFNGLITLNETAGTIFKALSEDRTLEELVTIVTGEYEIDTETAKADTEEFLQNLRQLDALIENNE